jgi:cell division septal protein FtsQ
MADVALHRKYLRPPRTLAGKLGRVALGVGAAVTVILVFELVVNYVIAREFTINRIVIESEVTLGHDEVLRLAGIPDSAGYFSVDPAMVEQRLLEAPGIRDAQVTKSFPDTLTIVVTERRPVAMALAQDGDRTVPVVFDEEGVIFSPVKAGLGRDFPIISGLRFEDSSPGTQLPGMLHTFLEDLKEIQLSAPVLYRQISECRVVRRAAGDLEVLLYPVGYRIPVRTGARLTVEAMKYMLMVLDVLEKDPELRGQVEELDFRTDEVVVRMKENQG